MDQWNSRGLRHALSVTGALDADQATPARPALGTGLIELGEAARFEVIVDVLSSDAVHIEPAHRPSECAMGLEYGYWSVDAAASESDRYVGLT